jgi:predicted AlkP superfamily pyrophosphatase or phosphodiesterase
VAKPLILVVIDGLAPSAFEDAIENGGAPTLALLAAEGRYRRGVTTFPSLTPVCLSSIATGGHPDLHHIPHLVWWERGEQRIVEYGSSFAALRAAGTRRSIRDAIVNMSQRHLNRDAVTMFEALEDAGLTAAAINFTCYRGRERHAPLLPGLEPVNGPKRFFFFNLFESDVTGAPIAARSRAAGSTDAYAAAVGRWLVTRDGFDFLAFYLPDYDFASHVYGPEGAQEALSRSDRAVGALVEAAGGLDDFLERYAVIVCADHAQCRVERAAVLQSRFVDADVVVTASNRAGMVYRLPGCREEPHELARRLDGDPSVDVTLFCENGEAVARGAGEETRFTPADGDLAFLDQPDAPARAWAALHNPNAGELIVSAAAGWEFADLAGRSHLGGGSHGALAAVDSEVPILTVGVEGEPRRIIDLAPLALSHFGVRELSHVV